jgi:acyl dehydratase
LEVDSTTLVISQADVNDYAHLSHDHNPLHVEPEHASTGPFGRTIAHGTIACAILQDLFFRLHRGGSAFSPVTCSFKFLSPLFPDVPTVFETASVNELNGDCQVRVGDRLVLVGHIRGIEDSGL